MFKKILKVLLVVSILILIFLFWAIRTVDYTPYFHTDYYSSTISRLDSIAKGLSISEGRIQIGFGNPNVGVDLIDWGSSQGEQPKMWSNPPIFSKWQRIAPIPVTGIIP